MHGRLHICEPFCFVFLICFKKFRLELTGLLLLLPVPTAPSAGSGLASMKRPSARQTPWRGGRFPGPLRKGSNSHYQRVASRSKHSSCGTVGLQNAIDALAVASFISPFVSLSTRRLWWETRTSFPLLNNYADLLGELGLNNVCSGHRYRV